MSEEPANGAKEDALDVALDVDRRLASLERQARLWKRSTWIAILGVAVGVGGLVAQALIARRARHSLWTHEIHVTRGDGREELLLWPYRLALTDARGAMRAELEAEQGTRLLLQDEKGQGRINLDAGGPSGSRLWIFGPDARPLAWLWLDTDGSSHFALFDERQTPRARVRVTKDGHPEVVLRDEGGAERVVTPRTDSVAP